MTQGASGPSKARVLAVIATIGPPITLISSVLVFFGWVKADAEAKALGLNVELFGYTTQDYVRFSMMHAAIPMVCLLVVGLFWLGLDRRLSERLRDGRAWPRVRRIAGVAAVAGFVLAGGALLLVVLDPDQTVLYAPYVVAVGVLLAAWAARLRRLAQAVPPPPLSIEQRAGEAALLLGLVAVLLFWGAADHARTVGQRIASDLEQHVNSLPEVELYSTGRLAIGAEGVTEEALGTSTAPLYRYAGLRLLDLSGGNLFFLPDGWKAGSGTVVVLPNNGTVRVEYGP